VNRNRLWRGVNTVHSLYGLPAPFFRTLTLPVYPPTAQTAFPFCTFGGSPAPVLRVAFVAAEVRAPTAPRLRNEVQAQASSETLGTGHDAEGDHRALCLAGGLSNPSRFQTSAIT